MATRLLLIEDVEDLGRSGDVVSVKPGYARNFLLPQGLARIADARTLRMQARLQEARRLKAIEDKNHSEEIVSKLEGLVLTKIVKVDHEGNMYGSVTSLDIVHMIEEQTGVKLEKRLVLLKHSIRELGAFQIGIRLKEIEGVACSIDLKIISEEAAAEQAQEG